MSAWSAISVPPMMLSAKAWRRRPVSGARKAGPPESIEPDEGQAGPLRDREGRLELHRARCRENEEDGRETDAEGLRRDVAGYAPEIFTFDPPAGAGLGADRLAVKHREPDYDGGREDRGNDDFRARRMIFQADDECQTDDRAIDDARNLSRPQMGFDRSSHEPVAADPIRLRQGNPADTRDNPSSYYCRRRHSTSAASPGAG